jgi:hypothetical protein
MEGYSVVTGARPAAGGSRPDADFDAMQKPFPAGHCDDATRTESALIDACARDF